MAIKNYNIQSALGLIPAAWTPRFTEFLHQYLVNQPIVLSKEVLINDAIKAAIDGSLKVEVEVFENGSFLDIGTPEDLIYAVGNAVKGI